MKKEFFLNIGSATDTGLIRKSNEDCCAVNEKNGLFIVADGLGGRSGGEVASKLAADSIIIFFKKSLKEKSRDDFNQNIKKAIKEAHEIILKASISNPSLSGMGTTLVLALFNGLSDLHIANVGDSRAYLYRNNKLSLLSKDHSLVAELVEEGKITKEEARTHRQRNIVTQVIGIDPFTECYQKKVNLKEKDTIILCSDGLWDMLSDEEIKEVLAKKKSPKSSCEELINAAKLAGGEDNITVIVIGAAIIYK